MKRIICDTGPLVGLLHKDDQWSKWAAEQSKNFQPPLRTCEIVVAEANFLLKRLPNGVENLLRLIEDGYLEISISMPSLNHDGALRKLLNKYSDTPMSLADACLVRMSEIYDNASVFTVDSDFLIYRKNGRKKIPLISPF